MNERSLSDPKAGIRYMGLDDPDEKAAYSFLLTYRVIKALFDLLKGSFDWAECIHVLKYSQMLRDASVAIIHNSIRSFVEDDRFDFEARNVILRDIAPGSERNGMMTAICLYPEEHGVSLVNAFLLRTQMAHFRHLQQSGRFQTWEDYLHALEQDQTLRIIMMNGFQDGLMRLDFKAGWLSKDIAAVTKLFDSESSTRR